MTDPAHVMPQKLGKYEVRREVGRGGMGVVYEGYDPIIERRVALKTLIRGRFEGPEAAEYLARFQREAQAAGRLSHPNIVAIYDYGDEAGLPSDGPESRTTFIAMEFIEGRALKNCFDANERFPIPAVVRIMSELLDALGYSHGRGVVHRDIKPANIMLLADGTVKITDFGIARIESSTLTQVGTVLGSPSYMSPEQFTGQTVDGRSDLYSAAVVLYQLLTGEVPFSGSMSNIMHRVLNEAPSPPSVLNVQVPKAFDAVLSRAMAKKPDERYPTAADFKQAILAAETRGPASGSAKATDVTMLRTDATGGGRDAGRPSAAVVLAGACACAVGVAAAAYFLLGERAAKPLRPVSSDVAATSSPSTGSAPPIVNTGGPARADAAPAAAATPPVLDAPPRPGTAVISAVGFADPNDPRWAKETAAVERSVWMDARRQLIEKATALYVDPRSITANYAVLRSKLLARSDEYITTVLEQKPPQISKFGLMLGTLRATVKVREVQKSLNQISRDERVEFIRNNGNPRIAVSIRAQRSNDDLAGEPRRSPVAENLLKERIRSFGFVIVDDQLARPPADFLVEGEVRFKRLSARLAASGLTIEKFLLTSWTTRAVDTSTGEEIYHNNAIPQKQSWATEELALQDVGRLIGAEFSKNFFLEYFDAGTRKIRLRFTGLPATFAGAVSSEINSALRVVDTAPARQENADMIIDTALSAGPEAASDVIQEVLLKPLNRKLGRSCFTVTGTDAAELHILFDSACESEGALSRLEALPPDALKDAPRLRIEDVVRQPGTLPGIKL